MGFPTFSELSETMLTYRAPSATAASHFNSAKNAVAHLRRAMLDVGADFSTQGAAIKTFGTWVGVLLPEATPETTALANQLRIVRMLGTRSLGGGLPEGFTRDDFRSALVSALCHLDVATASAIFSQSEEAHDAVRLAACQG